MTVELKKGYYIDSYYDKNTRSYITTLRDKDGNQIRDAYYSGNMTDRNTDIQHIKEFFEQYLNEALNLRKTIKDTREKTKKAKLPALSTLSPIMPDAAAGISTFNSGVGLSEDYIGRDELIKKLKDMGYKYNYPKYTDQELYEIYKKNLKAQETKKELKKLKEIEKSKKQRYKDKLSRVKYDEDSDTFSDGNYYKDGIEFESEAAAKEYFGESMDSKVYLNDMHKAWDIDESYNYELYDDLCSEYKSLYPYDITLDQVYDEIIDKYNDEDLANDVIENLESYEEENFYESKENKHEKVLNENLKVKRNSVKHNFKTITEGLRYFERKEFNENYRDAELEILYEGVKNNLDQDDIRKLGNFLKKADNADEVSTYIKGLLSEDLNNRIHIPYRKSGYGGFTTDGDDVELQSYLSKFNDVEGDIGCIYVAILLHSTISHSSYDKIIFSNDVNRLDKIITSWLYENIDTGDNFNDFTDEIHRYAMLIDLSKNKEIAFGDTWISSRGVRKGWREYSLNNTLKEAYSGSIENISVEDIEPQQKDYDRAKGLKFRGRTFKGSGEPFGSEASKMAKLIKDPIKLVRRAKAVVATYGADEGYMSNNGWYHHVAPDKESDVWGPFRKRLEEFGFTNDQISSISNFKPLAESLNEDWESGDPSIAEMIAEDILIGAEEEYGINASLYNIDFDKDSNTADIAISVSGFDNFMEFIENYFKPPVPEEIDKLIDVYEDEFGDDETIYTLVIKFKNNDTSNISNKNIDTLVDELISQLSQAGFIIDKNSSGITNNMMGGKHLQVINPNMFYPTSETEGEDITDEEAYKLFRDDLREVEGILDAFEDKYNKILFITFNFGHNKDMVITGGIDIHLFKGSK